MRVVSFYGHKLRASAGAANEFPAARMDKFNIMNHEAKGNILQGQPVARLDGNRSSGGYYFIANIKSKRRNHICISIIRICQKSQTRAAIRIIFNGSHPSWHIVEASNKINYSYVALSAAAAMADRDFALSVASSRAFFNYHQ